MRFLFLLFALAPVGGVFGLWPQPRSLETGSTALKLASTFDIHVDIQHAPSDLSAAISRTKSFLKNDKLGRLVVGRGSSDSGTLKQANALKTLQLSLSEGATVRSITEEARLAIGTRSEEYVLSIPADGSAATLTANSTLGLFRGLTTFTQLFYEWSGQIYTVEAPISITDSPAYPWRGFMLDTSRNFFPVADIKRTLDAMSLVKMSQFHWHVTDSQSFPLVIPGFTELASAGAYDPSMVYSPDEVQDIVDYAGARGIDVMVLRTRKPPAGQLRLASPTATNFTAEMLAAVARMFPSTLMSTGGDELNTNCYAQDAETQEDLKSAGQTLEQALNVFTQKTHAAIEAVGKTPAVWEGM
ncbi:hypothetical protein GSI_02935 [Ganoderma sinense ZZ0214-1]|uniref:beta-N-acetylhexosaminidase n=1 Tax=Ganoderma sinense ZZ0214-1 TaxID=1077348 RepID=A0A2G8SN02_9APHY|nr:hypothetical protein GSI_02935 [Ganoderma sinense ZZ0214-1]